MAPCSPRHRPNCPMETLVTNNITAFDVQGSVHLGNVYVRLTIQLDVHGFICILYSSIFALHVSGAICTHPQEHKLQSTALGVCNGCGMFRPVFRYFTALGPRKFCTPPPPLYLFVFSYV
jgi:hypothetical protein